jgi:hypothetical protein
MTSPVSMRSMLPRKSASMRVRAPVMRRSSKSVPNLGSVRTGGWLICS